MLTIITRQIGNEPDIMSGNEHHPLVVKTLDDVEMIRVMPSEAWTHDSLEVTALGLDQLFQEEFTNDGASAYLGEVFVGSTEV